jgi:phosphosulfolactate synthase
MNTFENVVALPLPGRSLKPRRSGLTMVIDKGLGPAQAADLAEIAHAWIDVVKLGFGTSRLCPQEVVARKVAIYRQHDIRVMPGGTLLEVVQAQRELDAFLKEARQVGFDAIEVSDGTIHMDDKTRTSVIGRAAAAGFMVFSEVGSKFADADLSAEETVREIQRDLELGAFQVIIEAREAGLGVGIYDAAGHIVDEKLQAIVAGADLQNVLFEAPQKAQQVVLIQKFGVNTSLGNISPSDVLALESLRAGLRADTLRGIYD